MSLKVVFPNRFTRKANRLARKYPALTAELRTLHKQLSQGERPGVKLQGAGGTVYKVRLANPSARRGKSGGFRVAYHVGQDALTLLAICMKPKCDDVNPGPIQGILKELALI